ncbi:MAG: hypothetical protein JWM88_271 [Verrucomicrobia bacterium]|nr:hypothetical protein [Verrucomicrobiota bacterium]
MFNRAKDFMTGKAAQTYINGMIGRYGEVRDLRIDTEAKTLELVCTLRGEAEPVTVRVDKYEIVQKGEKHFAQIVKCTCSRPWLQALVEDFAQSRPIEVPPWAVSAL